MTFKHLEENLSMQVSLTLVPAHCKQTHIQLFVTFLVSVFFYILTSLGIFSFIQLLSLFIFDK